jgi:hypothetical protein
MAIVRATGVLEDTVDGKAVLIGTKGTQIVELNELGSVVWAAINGQREVVDLAEVVRSNLVDPDEVTAERIQADIRALLGELTRLELVQP